ncbi:MAG TPA: 2-phosphosulfolactate phosphatase [Trebonia sp.]|jgi:hypothetical protein|nr:2-phosphosulfolactate phosphatase [Trebonia sp.]
MTGMNTRFLGIAELSETPSVAVVIDVMRAFTTAAWAFARGADPQPCAASRAAARLAEGARQDAQGIHPDDVALCLELDRFPFAMVAALEDSLMVLRPHAMPTPTEH